MSENKSWESQQKYIAEIRRRNEEKERKTGRPVFCHTHTYGCQQNVSDGERLDGMLAEMGYAFTGDKEQADLILFNTCAVREGAQDRVYGNVGALVHLKRRNPDLIIGLCGCMVQQEHVAQRIKKSFPYVDLVFGTHAIGRLPELLYRCVTGAGRVFSIEDCAGEIREDLPVRRDGTVRAWLPVMYGCDNFCTYCVVPLVRGRERSREPRAILDEARELIAQGYREITLLGQNVNSYGKGLEQPVDFSELLRELSALDGHFRIRFMTSHPKDCTRELIDTIAQCDKVCKHLHLPVQSGSDRILGAMNRRYTAEQYLALIAYAREKIPHIAFTSDIIVGFPGERREDFLKTLELVRQVGYHSLFTFLYSKREGTRAAGMEDPVPQEEKARCFQELLDTQAEIGAEKYRELVGKTVEVLAEGPGRAGDGTLIGKTDTGVTVEFEAPPEMTGRFLPVRVTEALQWAVRGTLAEEKQINHLEDCK